jgi:Glycosyl hydrolase-like 10
MNSGLFLRALVIALIAASWPLRDCAGQTDIKPDATNYSMRLRLTWGGGSDEVWRAVIRPSEGAINSIDVLGLTSDTPGSTSLDEQQLIVAVPSSCNFGGVDFTLLAPLSATVNLEIWSTAHPEQKVTRTVELEELRGQGIGGPLDQQGNRFLLTRAPGDQIQVDIHREHLVFGPRENWKLKIQPALAAQSLNKSARMVGKITSHSSSNQVVKTLTAELNVDRYGHCEPFEWEFEVPDREGVFDMTIEIESKWYQAAFSAPRALRKIQFLVLENQPPVVPEIVRWDAPVEIDLNRTLNINTAKLSPLYDPFKILPKVQSADRSRSVSELRAGEWQAIPLSLPQTDRPFKIRVEFDATPKLELGLSILEPDRDGNLTNFGFNSGTVHKNDLASEKEQKGPATATHEMLFWPNQSNPVLLLANRSSRSSLTVRKIELIGGPARLGNEISPPISGRKILAFNELPLFAENFAGQKSLDPITNEALEDWQTFYQSADRLIQYLKHSGHNGMMLAVNAQGGTLYPSQLWQSTPRFDSGRFFSSGQDPVQKDLLEMLFRMFDREGLQLVPAVTFATPLPQVEQAIRDGSDPSCLLVDYRGQLSNDPAIPQRYNPLSPTVQKATSQIVEEMLERYSSHQSFSGLAVVCRDDTFAILPGKRWGFDLVSMQRFVDEEMDGQVVLDDGNQSAFITDRLLGDLRTEWTSWRCEQLHLLYQRWENLLSKHAPQAKLYLAAVDVFRSGELASGFSPSMRQPADLVESLREIGWDRELWAAHENLVVLQPHRVAPTESLSEQRVEIHLAHSRQSQGAFGNQPAGSLFTHRDGWVHWRGLNEQVPGLNSVDVYRMQPVDYSESSSRQRYAEALFRNDTRLLIDGGWTLSTKDDDQFRQFAEAYSQLPNETFENIPPKSASQSARPVAVRHLTTADGAMSYVVNSSPWICRVTLHLEQSPRRQSNDFQVFPKTLVPTFDQDTSTCAVALEPYSLICLKSPDHRLINYEVSLSENAAATLRRHLHFLQGKLTTATEVKPLKVLLNPELNRTSGDQGWTFNAQPAQHIEFISVENESDNEALLLESRDSVTWVRSNWFLNTETGRITIAARLRTADSQLQPPLRISIESDAPRADYYRFAAVGSLAPSHEADNQLDQNWRQFVVHFDDLPLDPSAKLRIGFDLMGAGQVAVDRVEVYDRWFEKNELQAMTQMLASVGPLLSDSETVDLGRFILEGYWPRFIGEMLGETPNTQASPSAMQADNSTESSTEPARSGFMFRRLRRR